MKNKHLAAWLLVLCLALSLCGCSKTAKTEESSKTTEASSVESTESSESPVAEESVQEASGPAGGYKLTDMTAPDMEENIQEQLAAMEAMGMYTFLELLEDGSMTFWMYGVETAGTWTEDSLTFDETTIPATFKDDTIVMEQDGASLTFTPIPKEELIELKEKAAESPFATLPESEPAVGLPIHDYEPTVMYEDDNVVFTVEGFRNDDLWGYTMDVSCENKTDKTVIFTLSAGPVLNGYLVNSFLYEEVEAGQKTDSNLYFSDEEIALCGITEAEEILFTVEARDEEDYFGDPLMVQEVAVYPSGKTKDEITYAEREKKDTDFVIAENDDYTFLICGQSKGDWSQDIIVYAENKTDKTLNFDWEEVKVNGAAMDTYQGTQLPAHSRRYAVLSFYDEDLKAQNIETIEEISFKQIIYDIEDYENRLMDETFTYTVK